MDIIIDEIIYLYFQGYYLNEILNCIKSNQKQRKKKTSPKVKKEFKKESVTRSQCLDLSIKKLEYPDSFSKLDIKEHEAIQFNRILSKSLALVPGVKYQVLEPKGKSMKICFVGKFKEEGPKYVRLIHEYGYSETFLKSDLLSGEYLIKEA